MDRKDFLKNTCGACLGSLAIAALPGLESCTPAYNVFKATPVNNMLEVPLTVFDKGNLQMVRPQGAQYDIAIQKKADNTYSAMLMQCTHHDYQLNASQTGFTCALHGSRFDMEGTVRKGPAERPLKHYETSVNNNTLIIKI